MFCSFFYPFRLIYLAFLVALFRTGFIKSPSKVLMQLGPSFVKLGQTLSTRPDIVGIATAQDLSSLQDQLPAFAFTKARNIIERDLGKPLGLLFSSFDETPIAAASIAQVYHAKTPEGEEVAVKVLRPGVRRAFANDIHFFFWTARLLERFFPSSRRIKPVSVVRTLEQSVALELDLRLEAAAASELKDNCANEAFVHIPTVYWSHTAQHVLTTEWVKGISIYEKDSLIAAGHDLKDIASYVAITFFNQAYRDGFFHADLHPGNVLIDHQGRLVLLDFGIMGRLQQDDRLYVAQILKGFVDRDYVKVAQIHIDAGYVPADTPVSLFAQACRAIGEPIVGLPVSDISLANLLAQLFKVTKDFSMETQPQLLLLQKTMVLVEGIGSLLDPHLNMWTLAEPWVKEWAQKHLGAEARITSFLKDTKNELVHIPSTLKHLRENISASGIKLHPDTLAAIQKPRKVVVQKCWSYFIGGIIFGTLLMTAIWYIYDTFFTHY